jgi:uncharacterized protein
MSTAQTQDVVNNFFRFLTQRNLDGLTNLFSENIDWYIPGDQERAPWLGVRNSRKEVKEFYELLWKNTEPVDARIDNIFVQDKSAVVAGEFSTRMLQTNKTVSSLFFIHITVENNLIVRYRLLEDSYAVSIALT